MSSAENPVKTTSELSFDAESGISKEDQKDILQAIENVVTQNKIAATPEDFVVKAAKRGILFPSLVIAAAALALVVGGAAFYFLFQKGETQITRGTLGTITAEGQLIQAVRQEANARLQEKNQEITSIQGRLADIDKQRQDLQSNMDTKVNQKEEELRAQMASALATEKSRLEAEGLSRQAVALRMTELEKQRSGQLEQQLEAYRKQANVERALAEKNLATLQQNYEANLAQANTEKQQVTAEAQKREADLRGQFSQKTQTLESAKARAEQQLAAMSAQRDKEDLVTGQLTGLYGVVSEDITQHEYDKALDGLKSLRDFVNRTDITALPTIAKRHDFDIFVIDTLTSYVQGEIDKEKIDTATLLQAANQFTILRQQVADAQTLLKAGKTADAEKAYAAALNLIPEVATSYAYFVGRDKEAEAAKEAHLVQALDNAENAYVAGNFAAAANFYSEAFSFMPVSAERIQKAISNLEAAGFAQGLRRTSREQAAAAKDFLSQANALQTQGKYDDALAAYLNVLARYPLADQSKDAIAGIQATVKSISENAGATNNAQRATLGGQIASLQQTATTQKGDIASLQQNVQEMQDKFAALDKSYNDYIGQEDPVLKKKGDAGLMETMTYFDAFFLSAAVQGQFPGISDKVKRYELGYQSAGRQLAFQDVITVVDNYSSQRTPELKRQFIQSELKAYARDPDMTELLKDMDKRLGK
jgi:chromosome segregation ATPase